ncbi:Calcineurin-like phosphoesterase [Gillisia sp. Hel1_33_143]|uniref:metallophosphoesterase n=1 Tax=Gillisia sp. Hel1_33_143 TaxID=1336796 RepID=UPI000879D2B5|nr:metallophosphoesterase [Gillisia sp. Hel1_33_143]SDS80626.1 Calcineurin-like phosphoesterase [Gillisia sp. Hel1_33_143]
MKKNNIILTILGLFLILSCSTYAPKYRTGEPSSNFEYPLNKKIEKTFYLVGDAGYSPPGGSSAALLAFKSYINSVNSTDNYAIFLGDNIYPVGMPSKNNPSREQSEYRLDAQLDALESYDGNVIFIPGNHDWYSEGIEGLNRQKDYLKEKYPEKLKWAPDTGNGFESVDISEKIQLLIIDSQWYLEDWDRHPLINDNSPQIKSREAMFNALASELDKNQDKTVVIALHHPVFTNGVHGGQYNFARHIYPAQKKIPIPVLGSLASLIRTSGGVSIQDAQNERYKSLAARLKALVQNHKRSIFVSGHEHGLQYIEHDSIRQIVSGSGSKDSYVVLSNDGLFASAGEGFAVYDVFEDGSSWVSYFGSENNKLVLLYQKEVFEAPKEFDSSDFPEDFEATKIASVYSKEETEKGEAFKTLWGDRYRALYGTDVTLKVADLDTLYGGLTPIREGGGHQTISVRVKDSLGREYNLRRVKKKAIQFLQTVAFKGDAMQDGLENTIAEDLVQDFYTSAHPYGFLAIPTLADAVNINHTNPKVYYLPKQKTLGKYNNGHGDEIYMIEERPEEGWKGYPSFGYPNEDIISTEDMFEKLRKDEKYKLDEAAYVRARVFDMLIGDWDRHSDQWRWSEKDTEDGLHMFEPVPRDRDQVFSNFDGAFFGTLRGISGFAKQFAVYGEDINNVKWFNTAATGLDRELLQNVGKETWLQQAKYVQEHITNDVIEDAFSKLPPETQGETSKDLIQKLKGRRDNIVDISKRYYDYLATLAIVTGTDKDDFIDITRMPNGLTNVKISRDKDGKRAEILSEKTYSKEETNEIWIYGLDDDDKINVGGEGDNYIFLRIIGGQNNDVYSVKNSNKLKIHDYKSQPNTFIEANSAKVRLSDSYNRNTYDKDKKIYSSNSITPGFGYNPDEGFKIGVESVKSNFDFKRNPFTSQHTYGVGYYFGTDSYYISYAGEFANIVGNFNLEVGGYFNNPNFTQNFFGYGNQTKNYDDDLGYDYNRVGVGKLGIHLGLVRQSPFGSYFGYKATFETVEVKEDEGRFITNDFVSDDQNLFSRKYFAGADAMYRYESYDNILNPTRGMKFELNLGGQVNTADVDQVYGYFKPYLGFYNALIPSRKLVLKSSAQAQVNIGDDYEFYQSAQLGGDNGLRSFREDRFSGKKYFVASGDLRYSFDQFKTRFLPLQIGVFGGYDIGRVWSETDASKAWHDSYGGGFWINSAGSLSGNVSLFSGDEGARISVGLGLTF